jgi:glutathione S-transferase
MMTLYHMDHCPYCIKVRNVIEELGLEVALVDAQRGSEGREKVIALGGQSMVPFLVDSSVTPEVQMYESNEIIEYLKTKV